MSPHWILFSLLAIPPTPRDLDAILQAGRDAWHIPGLVAVVVYEDRIVYLKAFGVKQLGSPDPITPDTIFPLASCTKPFTALAVAQLVDGGVLDWDEPVRKHLPNFHLKDRLADERVTLRDLLCHRTGLARHDLLWYRSPWTVEERLLKVALLEPDADFRTRFQYQPVLFGAAGVAAAKAAKTPWDQLVDRRILEPLGMTSSAAARPKHPDRLTGFHRRAADDRIVSVPAFVWKEPDPAGSLHSTARDLAAFLRLQLGGTDRDGTKLVSRVQLDEMHHPQMPVRREGMARIANPESTHISYGLGWAVQDYRGRTMLLHGGNIDGARVQMTLVPDARLGIALLSNLEGHFGNMAMTNQIVDRYLGTETRDWQTLFLDVDRGEIEAERKRGRDLRAEQRPGTKPPLPLDAYAGDYVDPAYGTCRIRVAEGSLTIAWGDLRSPLEHVAHQRFLATEPPCHDAPFEFRLEGGAVVGVRAFERDFGRK